MKSTALILLAVATAISSGCASYRKNFQNKTVVNIGYCAGGSMRATLLPYVLEV